MVTVQFECGGCFKKVQGTTWLTRRFVSVTGKSWGVGHYQYDTPQDIAPKGWIAFDPYTGCCYCPECWEYIEGGVNNDYSMD